MITLFFIVLGVFLLFIVAMAVGVIFGKAPIKGSCGGLGKIMGKDCAFCKNKNTCKKKSSTT